MVWYFSGLIFMGAIQMYFEKKMSYDDAAGLLKISTLGPLLIVIVPIVAIAESDWWEDKAGWWRKHKDDVFWRI